MVPASGPGLDLALQRWRSQPQLPSLRSLRDSGGIKLGWDPGPLPRCLRDNGGWARPSKRARTSGPGVSSSSRPQPSPSTATEESSSPHLSPASRIRQPLFTRTPIPGNVDLRAKDFHGESFYDVTALTTNPRFRDSMRLITKYSLLSFMTPRQFYYPRVVLQFYHSMTFRGVLSPLKL